MRIPDLDAAVEVVRGRLPEDRAAEILRFWSANGALGGEEARRRLAEVTAVLVRADGEILGVSSAYADDVALVGGRRFWVYRSFLLPAAADAWKTMVHATYQAVLAEFDPSVEGPIGLAVPVADRAELAGHREANWLYPQLLYAGYLADGRQLRIIYFTGARVGRARPVADWGVTLDRSYRVDVFAEQDMVSSQAIVDMWLREGAMAPEEASRRVSEVVVVATHGGGEPVGVGTAFLRRNDQLGMDLWHYRAFVAAEHRAGRVGVSLGLVARDHLQSRFVGGQDLRGQGMLFEVENAFLKEHFDQVVWYPQNFSFVGANARGDHLRVNYFPGALAPEPPA